MPAKSGKQYRFMQGVAHGSITGTGPSKATAEEYVHATPGKKRKKFAKELRKFKGE